MRIVNNIADIYELFEVFKNLTFDRYNLTPGSRMELNVFFLCLEGHRYHHYRVSAQSMHFEILTFDPDNLTPGLRMKLNVFFSCLDGHRDHPYRVWTQSMHFEILTYFDLWPLNGRSDDGVTVKTIARLSMKNMLAQLFLRFEILHFFGPFQNWNWPFDPFNNLRSRWKKIHTY